MLGMAAGGKHARLTAKGARAVPDGDSELQLPDPDDRFSQLILDHFAPQHVFVAEGEGARCIIDLFKGVQSVTGRKVIFHADTVRLQSPGYNDHLKRLGFDEFEARQNRLEILRLLPFALSQIAPPFRLYVAASRWFIQVVEAIAERAGVSREQILIEECDGSSRKVVCLICSAEMLSCLPGKFNCRGCGEPLQVTGYYNPQSHTHLAVPVHLAARLAGEVQ